MFPQERVRDRDREKLKLRDRHQHSDKMGETQADQESQRKTQRETGARQKPGRPGGALSPAGGQDPRGEGDGELSLLLQMRPPHKPCLSLKKMDPPPSLMTMLSAQTLINTLS